MVGWSRWCYSCGGGFLSGAVAMIHVFLCNMFKYEINYAA